MKVFLNKKTSHLVVFLFLFCSITIGVIFFSVSATEYVEFEEDTIFSLDTWDRLPYTFYINAGCKAEYAEWIGNVLTISGIPNGTTCSIRADLETIIELNLYSGQEGYLELSSDGGVVSTGGMITFGKTDIEIFGLPSYSVKPYVISGSRAESAVYSGDTLIVNGIPKDGFFGTQNDTFNTLKATPTHDDRSHIEFSTLQFAGSGYLTDWKTNSTGSITYEAGVGYPNEFYEIQLNGVVVFEDALLSYGSPTKILFSNAGSGEYFINHLGLVDFEEDTIFALQSWGALIPNRYIAAGSKAESVEYIGDILNVISIPAQNTFHIKTDNNTVLRLTPREGKTNLTIYGADITFEGHTYRYFIETTGIVDYVVGTYLEGIPYVVSFNGQPISGSPFNSGVGKQLIFNTSGNGEVLISAPGVIFDENFPLELDNLN